MNLFRNRYSLFGIMLEVGRIAAATI